MNKYLLHGKLAAVNGQGDQLAAILPEAAKLMSAAPGCGIYAVSRDPADPEAIWVTGVRDTREDHDGSLHLEGVRKLTGQALPLLAGQPGKGQELKLIGGTGI